MLSEDEQDFGFYHMDRTSNEVIEEQLREENTMLQDLYIVKQKADAQYNMMLKILKSQGY